MNHQNRLKLAIILLFVCACPYKTQAQTGTGNKDDLSAMPTPSGAECVLWRTKDGKTTEEQCNGMEYFSSSVQFEFYDSITTPICTWRTQDEDELIRLASRCFFDEHYQGDFLSAFSQMTQTMSCSPPYKQCLNACSDIVAEEFKKKTKPVEEVLAESKKCRANCRPEFEACRKK